jgi:predicted DNA-binding transcriptional regulator AlpA
VPTPEPVPPTVIPLRRATDHAEETTGPRRGPMASSPSAAPLPVFLSPEELAALLGLPSVETVYQWRRKHTGPPGFRAGRHLRYALSAVLEWTREQTERSA